MDKLPLGKLPPKLLANLLAHHEPSDPRVLLGPGVGLDCAVLDFGERLLVAKSDPITFTEDEIGWYAVHVNANDIATTGAQPHWFLATVLLPEKNATPDLAATIFQQIESACQSVGAQLVGGHTEITTGLDHTIVAGTMLGEVMRERLITPRGARPGDRLLLTKGVPIEATSILAREFPSHLAELPPDTLTRAIEFLHRPGISVVPEALSAAGTGLVTAMHDPTEGGLASGVWELAQAANVGFLIDREAIPIPTESAMICSTLGIDPLEAIASGALLLTVKPDASERVCQAIEALGIAVSEIGWVTEGQDVAMRTEKSICTLPWPARDAIARLFEEASTNG
jgi:hydrogenase maturation factor